MRAADAAWADGRRPALPAGCACRSSGGDVSGRRVRIHTDRRVTVCASPAGNGANCRREHCMQHVRGSELRSARRARWTSGPVFSASTAMRGSQAPQEPFRFGGWGRMEPLPPHPVRSDVPPARTGAGRRTAAARSFAKRKVPGARPASCRSGGGSARRWFSLRMPCGGRARTPSCSPCRPPFPLLRKRPSAEN